MRFIVLFLLFSSYCFCDPHNFNEVNMFVLDNYTYNHVRYHESIILKPDETEYVKGKLDAYEEMHLYMIYLSIE